MDAAGMRTVPWPFSSEQVAGTGPWMSILGSQLGSLEAAEMAEEWSIEHRTDSPGRSWMIPSTMKPVHGRFTKICVTFVPPATAAKT